MVQAKKKKQKNHRRQSLKVGMSPGSVAFIGEQKVDKVRIDAIQYDTNNFNELPDISFEKCHELLQLPGVIWINVFGIHSVETIKGIGKIFDLHPLTLEDIANTVQRLKVEEFPSYLFFVLKMLNYIEERQEVTFEHISLILGQNYVVTFQEEIGDVFDEVRDRIRKAKGRLRSMKSDYLAYALMDAVVDHYFLAVELIGDRIEEIDDQILEEPNPENIKEIHLLKRGILNMRKAVWPLREEIGTLGKNESGLIHQESKIFWRDLYDHTIQIIDMVETYRDILGGMHDTYLSSVSNRMNEIMKVLTIIATVFIPLTFIVGIYGMNFQNMPELKWTYGYYMVWGIMLAIGIGLMTYFKRKKWF
jgi:magnesium transporter